MRLSDSLEQIVRSERVHGSSGQSGRGDASFVIEIYKNAQDTSVDAKKLLALIRERRRIGRQWQRLAGPSPLFLLVYSNYAETIV